MYVLHQQIKFGYRIINSYDNQKDTISKNINYLKYFYHLFPTHVEKFYSLFGRYVNPKIEQLKSYINELYSQNKSIASEITNLGKTKQSIENLSKQITENVTELNNNIDNRDRFKSLVGTIKKQLVASISDLKAMDKTKEIDEILCKIVEKIKEEDDKILQSIKKELEKHGEDVKRKLTGYIDITKKGLNSVKTKMSDLEEKILNYIKVGGTFQKLQTQMKAYYRYVNYDYISRNKFIGLHSGIESGRYENVKQKLLDLNSHFNIYEVKIERPKNRLGILLTELIRGYRAQYLIEDFENHKGDYTQILPQIPDFVGRLKLLENFGGEIDVNKEPMKDLIEIISSIESAKSIVDQNKQHLDTILPFRLNDTLTFTTNDIHRLISDITILRRTISTSIKRLENTKLLIEYNNSFKLQKKEFEAIKIDKPKLRVIGKLISSMKKFRKGYDELTRSISQYSHKLFGGFERRNQRTKNHRKNRREYLPTTMPLGRKPLKEITGQIKKLRAIQSFSPSLNGYSIGSLHLIQGPEGSDVDALLGELEELDETLRDSGHIGFYVGKISESYKENKEKINGKTTQNGNEIQSHVDKINKIPDKIAELHKSVRIYMNLTEIASKVIGTLDKMKPKEEKLTPIGGNIGHLIGSIPFIVNELRCTNCNMRHIFLFDGAIGLNSLRYDMNVITRVVKKLGGNVESLKMGVQIFVIYSSIIQEYQKILRDIYAEIEGRRSQLITFMYGTQSYKSTLEALATDKKGEVFSSLKKVTQYLKCIILRIIKLMTCLSEIECYICCTKRKLECFVSSLETRARWIDEGVREVELYIKSVITCFLKCSNESITNNTIKSTKRLLTSGGRVSDNELAKRFLRFLENMGCKYNIWSDAGNGRSL